MDKRILDIVSSPADLKLLTNEELSILAQEVREEIITTASETGGMWLRRSARWRSSWPCTA